MKHDFKKALSLTLAALLSLSVLASGAVFADEAVTETYEAPKAASPATDISKLSRVVVNMRSSEGFNEKMEVYAHKPSASEPDPNTGGQYAFNDQIGAMEVLYSESEVQDDFRIMTKFTSTSLLPNDHKFMVLVYRVDTKDTYKLHLWNSMKKGQEVVFAANGADTKGEFLISEPMDISLENGKDQTIMSRWLKGSINTISIDSKDKDLKFYIKEISFFKSAADAKAYYAAVDINKDPVPFEIDAIDYSALPDPVAIEFKRTQEMINSGYTYFVNDKDAQSTIVSATEKDGKNCIKLNYSPYDGWESYRVMPKFTTENAITPEHKYIRVVYMTTDTTANELRLRANSGGGNIVIAGNTAASGGKWIVSDAILIEGQGAILQRWIEGKHNTLLYTSTDPNSEIYIKEIVFFSSLKQAGEYYGDTAINYQSMTFGASGNSAFTIGENYGVHSVNANEATLDITWADSTNMSADIHYMAKIKFSSNYLADANKFVRILYSAEIPSGETGTSLYLRNDNGGHTATFVNNMKDTNGEFVLSNTVEFPLGLMQRLSGSQNSGKPMHASLCSTSQDKNAKFRIKAIYFFPEKSAADKFTVVAGTSTLTIGGKDIADYRIVVSESAGDQTYLAAEYFRSNIKTLTGVDLKLVTDKEPAIATEITFGLTNREVSKKHYDELAAKDYNAVCAEVEGTNLSFNAVLPPNLSDLTESYLRNFLYLGIKAPEAIALTDESDYSGVSNDMIPFNSWEPAVNVANPEHFVDTFDADNGYWQEEANTSDWSFANGAYSVNADGFKLSYIHVYEQNVKFAAKMKYSSADADGEFGLMLRYTAADAFVKAGYNFAAGEWYIESREGNDFNLLRVASAKAAAAPETWYDLVFTVDGGKASLAVNGSEILTANVTQITMGRVAVYAENAAVSVDDADIALLSGKGTILKNITHLKIDNDLYTEGGSAIVMKDNSVIFEHTRLAMKSTDDGYTWTSVPKQLGVNGYPNILRLNNGDLLRANVKSGGNQVAQVSKDDGKTWETVGTICPVYWNGTTAGSGNMNDKLTQSATSGRIFFGMNYEASKALDNGRRVFCEFYYSDDNGVTWTKSETDSWEIEGNEEAALFGEAKLIECADGTIRMYGSWHEYGCLVYSDSTDGGKTFGPLVLMEDFICARSSVQFCRDPYADNGTTYYMVWVNSPMFKTELNSSMSRAAITLAKSVDGKNWTVIGDIWRWQSNYRAPGAKNLIQHVVDPFVLATENTVIVGSGISEQIGLVASSDLMSSHQAQREHLWTLDKNANEPGENLYSFTDVTTKDSFYEAVKYAVDGGLFNGTSETTFSPAASMTRAMFVTVLGRLAKADTAAYATPTFNDVVAGQWYTSYVEWAAANGIVNGLGNGIYGINDNVTVQQACVILARYADYKTASAQTGKTAADFADGADVASWAAKEVDWAIANGVYAPSANLNPTTAASRATVATMFANYVKAFGA